MGAPKRPDAYANSVCPVCGKEFAYLRSQYRKPKAHCGTACKRVSEAKTKQETTCPGCGKRFTYHLSWPRIYCSRQCSGKANVANIRLFQPTGYDAACEMCGAVFRADKTRRGRFCSLKCWGESNHRAAAARRALLPPRPPKNSPASVTLRCAVCDNAFLVKPSHVAKRKCCSRKCSGIFRAPAMRGPANRNWTGGEIAYYGASWREARRKARARDKVCQKCGKTPKENGKALDVHHILPFKRFGVERHAEANALENLISYCITCHLSAEPRRTKKSG